MAESNEVNEVNPYSSPQSKVDVEQEHAPAELIYAGFWRRFGAYWIDVAAFLPLIGVSMWAAEHWRLSTLYLFFPSTLFGLWFHIYLVKHYGGTPGKLVLNTRVVCTDGSAVGYREATIRHAVLFLLGLGVAIALVMATLKLSDAQYLSLGFVRRGLRLVELTPRWYPALNIALNIWVWSEFIVIMCNKKRRGLHDFMAGTVVVRTKS